MTNKINKEKIREYIFEILIFGFVFYFSSFILTRFSVSIPVEEVKSVPGCGVKEFVFDPWSDRMQNFSQIVIDLKECGLAPQITTYFSNNSLKFVNHLAKEVDLIFVYYNKSSIRNRVGKKIKGDEQINLKTLVDWSDLLYGAIFIDENPEAGMSFFHAPDFHEKVFVSSSSLELKILDNEESL